MTYNTGWERRAAEIERAKPKWADDTRIESIYRFAKRHGLHVDHIVPFNSKSVCGLHCEENLRAIPDFINSKKSNRSWPGKWLEQLELIEVPHGIQLPLFN